MRKFWTSVGTAAILLTSLGAIAGGADFTLINGTGYTIREVYLSPASAKRWGNDRLGDGDLENGKSRLIRFKDSANCEQDLQVVFDKGDTEVVWSDLDLCEIDNLTLKYNRATKTVSAIKE
jgi:hypothetical protein